MTNRVYTKEWITEVRGSLNKTEFGKRIYIYKKNGSKCVTAHRNTITNWEAGKTELPKDVETFLSFALLEYDQMHPEAPVTLEERNNRYLYARNTMLEMLGVDLYCRNLHDALLIQVCRGILSFEEVLPLEKELEEELDRMEMTVNEKNLYAIERNTIPISDALNKVTDLESLKEVITVIHRNSFASANRIIGARFSKVYQSRKRYGGEFPLGKAVTNLAPNYRDSYVRMFKSSNISRRWMLDLCRHLRFSSEEIDRVLESAHMVPVAEDEIFPDACAVFPEKSLLERLMILFIMGAYIQELALPEECPPADYILESFSLYEQGQRVVVRLVELLEEKENQELEWSEIWEKLWESAGKGWISYLELDNSELTVDERLQKICKEERKEYFYPEEKIGAKIKKKEEVQLLRFFAALMYTVLSGHHFPGSLTERDLNEIRKSFWYGDVDCGIIFRFITQVLGTFLGGRELMETPDYAYYVQNEVKKTLTHPLNFAVILEDLWESVMMLLPYRCAQTEVDCSD